MKVSVFLTLVFFGTLDVSSRSSWKRLLMTPLFGRVFYAMTLVVYLASICFKALEFCFNLS